MRVLVDTNIFISYLLINAQDNTITKIVEAGFENKYTLLLPYEIINELNQKLTEKKYLASHISNKDAKEFTELLKTIAEEIPTITEEIPILSRDKKDDYLLAYAVVGKADYLVSGDEDLRKLKKVEGVIIINPIEFLNILES